MYADKDWVLLQNIPFQPKYILSISSSLKIVYEKSTNLNRFMLNFKVNKNIINIILNNKLLYKCKIKLEFTSNRLLVIY